MQISPFDCQEVDASSLGWAMSAVSSRAFKLHGNKQSNGINFEIPMMLPLIDMCNNSFNPNDRIVQEQETGENKDTLGKRAVSPEMEVRRMI
ncbi:rubisco methyltransferase family protein [Medicago truncatula]|uniref:Rubisco methyltransferase family protein n=1 Tax=Medicago truncatula TaxID=3880 RepID=A0A072VJJ1_MEDTR|nr:rubisco methyltransferase family protein [Medicago truncatula]